MELSTFIKLVLLLTILFGNVILSVTSKSLTSSRNNCRCGVINSPHRITGGKYTNPHAYPWQARILIHYSNDNYATICGGTVINNMYILTAAHCVYKMEEKFEVALGVYNANNLFNHRPFYKVVHISIHQNFDYNTKRNDIAILKVNPWIKFNRNVKPICLQNQYEQIEGKRATVIGWGITKDLGSLSDILKEATLQVLEDKRCREKLRQYYYYSKLCAFGGINASCGGDSGGPLFYTNKNGTAVQIGIVSYVYEEHYSLYMCGGQNPGIYTKISIFLDWIHRNTKDATYCKRKM